MKYKKPIKKKQNDMYANFSVFLPVTTLERLRELASENQLTISRLIAIAVDNELDCEPPFYYPCEIPDKYREYMYAKEAGRLRDWLAKSPKGVSIDSVMLCRRDMGIPGRETVMAALKELIEKDMAEIFAPTIGNRSKAYNRVRLKDQTAKVVRSKRYKRIEGESTRHQRRIKDEEIDRG